MRFSRPLAFVAALGHLAFAQAPAPRSAVVNLTLDEAIAIAKQNNPTYLGTATQLRTADLQVRSAYGGLLPYSNASLGANYYQGGSQVIQGLNLSSSSNALASNYFVGLNYTINGQSILNPKYAKANRQATEATVTGAAETLRSQVEQEYIAVLTQQATAQLQDTLVLNAKGQLDLTAAKQAVGAATLLDIRSAEVALGQAQVNSLTGHNNAALEMYKLYQLLGVPKPDSVALTTQFPVAEPTFVLDSLLDLARRTNPQILALRETARAYGVNVKMYQSAYTPTLSMGTGLGGQSYEYADPNYYNALVASASANAQAGMASCLTQDSIRTRLGLSALSCGTGQPSPALLNQLRASQNTFPFHFNRTPMAFSAQLSLPIFDRFNREYNVQEARVNEDNARYNARAQELQTITNVTQAYLSLMNAYKTIALNQQNASYAQEALNFANERYRVGAANFLEVTQARVTNEQAQINRINAIYSYHQAFAQLEGAVGRPLR